MNSVKQNLLQKLQLCYLYYYYLREIPLNNQFLQIRWHPEGSGRFPEACPEAYASIPVSPQFQKVGKVSGSLFLFVMYRCSSGSFRKVPGSLSGSLFELVDLPHSGSFRKATGSATGRGIEHQMIDLGLVSRTSLQSSMLPTSTGTVALLDILC